MHCVAELPQVNKFEKESFFDTDDRRIPFLSINPNYLVLYRRSIDRNCISKEITKDIKPAFKIPQDLMLFPGMYANVQDTTIVNINSSPVAVESNSLKNLKVKKHNGLASSKCNMRINLAINWLAHISRRQRVWCDELQKNIPFTLNFITLTLPVSQIKSFTLPCGKEVKLKDYSKIFYLANKGFGKINYNYTDHFCKKELLNHFLTVLRRKYNVHAYVWRAETQENGNIHFHITLNKFIFLVELRELWNSILAKTDMISIYQKKFSDMSLEKYLQYRAPRNHKAKQKAIAAWHYGNSSSWLQPNTTDVHAVWRIKNMAAYLSSYMTKENEERRYVEGCLWRLSTLLSHLKKEIVFAHGVVEKDLDYLFKHHRSRFKVKEHATILTFSIKDLKEILPKSEIVKKFVQYKNSIFRWYLEKFNKEFSYT
jgi:hypothetical protein